MKNIVACLLIFVAWPAPAQEGVYKDLSPTEFREKMKQTGNAVLLDLRTPEELKDGMLENAVHMDYFQKEFEKKVKKLDKDKPYFLYCAGGGRSGETLALMKQLGFREVYNLEGGITAWKNADLPIEKRGKN